MGYITLPSKTSHWGCLSALAAGGRPRSIANGQIFDRWKPAVDRPVDRPNPENKCSLAGRPLSRLPTPYGRPVGRPPKWLASVHVLCTSVDRSDRPTLGPVDRPGRPPEPGRLSSGTEKLVFNYSKNSHKFLKNPQK